MPPRFSGRAIFYFFCCVTAHPQYTGIYVGTNVPHCFSLLQKEAPGHALRFHSVGVLFNCPAPRPNDLLDDGHSHVLFLLLIAVSDGLVSVVFLRLLLFQFPLLSVRNILPRMLCQLSLRLVADVFFVLNPRVVFVSCPGFARHSFWVRTVRGLPFFEYAQYPSYSSYYSKYCFTDANLNTYDSFDYQMSYCDPYGGYCPDECTDDQNSCTIVGTCLDPNAAFRKFNPHAQAVHASVYNRKKGAFALTNFKTATRKIVKYTDPQKKLRFAEVFEVTLQDRTGQHVITKYFGHEIKPGNYSQVEEATKQPPFAKFGIELVDQSREPKTYRVHTHHSVQ